MKLTNMKLSKGSHAKTSPGVMLDSKDKGPDYPWGLRLNLDHDTLTKMGVKDLPKVGSKMQIHAHGHVHSVSENSSKGEKPRRSVDIQITHLGVGKNEPSSALDAVDDGIDKANG